MRLRTSIFVVLSINLALSSYYNTVYIIGILCKELRASIFAVLSNPLGCFCCSFVLKGHDSASLLFKAFIAEFYVPLFWSSQNKILIVKVSVQYIYCRSMWVVESLFGLLAWVDVVKKIQKILNCHYCFILLMFSCALRKTH